MGHQDTPGLPDTRRWREIVQLIHLGAGPEQVAQAVLRALRAGLGYAGRDAAVVESVWLLFRVPQAARADDFADALRDLGLTVGDAPDLFDLVARTLPDHVGPNRRFASLADQAAFRAALHDHCRDIARVVEGYSADWFSKTRVSLDGPIDRAAAGDYASYGFQKMLNALSHRAEAAHA